jgi:hypothetical protein
VRAECAKRNREKAKGRGNSTKHNHLLCYLRSHFSSAKVLISFASAYSRNGKARFPYCAILRQKGGAKTYLGEGRLPIAKPSTLVDPAFAFRVKRVVNNNLTLENFVV